VKNRKATVVVEDNGRIQLPLWVAEGLLKQSGSKATSLSGQRKAIKKQFIKLLEATIAEDKK